MSAFKEIEELEDEASKAQRSVAGLTQRRLEKIKSCRYRKNKAMYDIRCKHPERAKGRQCVNLNCPVLNDIVV